MLIGLRSTGMRAVGCCVDLLDVGARGSGADAAHFNPGAGNTRYVKLLPRTHLFQIFEAGLSFLDSVVAAVEASSLSSEGKAKHLASILEENFATPSEIDEDSVTWTGLAAELLSAEPLG